MGFHVLSNLFFLLAVFILIILFLRRLPEASQSGTIAAETPIEQKLSKKGLPALAASKTWSFIKYWLKKIWNFALEAKDLKPADSAGYKIRRLFLLSHKTRESNLQPNVTPKNLPVAEAELEQELLTAIKADPKNLAHYDSLGKFYMEKENFSEGKDIYRYLINHDSGNAEYHSRLANCYYRLGDFTNSAQSFEKSLSLDSTQPNRYYNLGLAWEASQNFGKSLRALQQAIALEPDNSRFYYAMGSVLEKLGKKKEAITAFKKSHRLDPQNLQAFERLKQLV